jgi:hypothetical protein
MKNVYISHRVFGQGKYRGHVYLMKDGRCVEQFHGRSLRKLLEKPIVGPFECSNREATNGAVVEAKILVTNKLGYKTACGLEDTPNEKSLDRLLDGDD